jgi:hypothetical protein
MENKNIAQVATVTEFTEEDLTKVTFLVATNDSIRRISLATLKEILGIATES